MSEPAAPTPPAVAAAPTGITRAAKIRACLAGVVVSAGIAGVAYRAWALQVDEADQYRAQAERQHEMRVAIPAPRGEIVDARDRPLAISADTDSVWANPRDIKDVTATADLLAPILDTDPAALEAKLGTQHRFVWLARHVPPELARRVRDAKLAGIEVAREPRRWYPARTIAGPIVGRADIDGHGVDGVELSLEALLAGKNGEALALRDARGHAMLSEGRGGAEPGAKVQLTIDRSIQMITDDALADAVISHGAKTGVAVVLDVATSQVIAMSSFPTYDPNGEPVKGARNRPVTDAFEAGSLMKVFSIAAALDDGTVAPDTEFNLTGGQLVIGPAVIHDVENDKYLTVAGIIKRSSNVGAAKIALRFGRDKLYAGFKRFGFGAKTSIELPGEVNGRLRDGKKWRDIELATMSYGYGLTVTPIQVAAALASIGNGGLYTEPRVVAQVTGDGGDVLYAPKPEQRRVLSQRTASELLTILASVFDKGKDGGTAKDIDVPGFRCGGKTGTARKYDPETHQYSTEHYLASFAGLAPIEHPRLAIVVMIDDPAGVDYYGAKVAAPAFAVIATQALRYLGVPGSSLTPPPLLAKPPKKPAPAPPAPPRKGAFIGLGLTRALDLARAQHLAVTIHGTGRVISADASPTAVTLTLAE